MQAEYDSFELMDGIILLYHATVKLPIKQREKPVKTAGNPRLGGKLCSASDSRHGRSNIFQYTIAIACSASDDDRYSLNNTRARMRLPSTL